MSVPTFGLKQIIRPLLEGVRSTRLKEVEADLFPASPFWPENEMTGTDRPSARSAGHDDGNRLRYGKRGRQPPLAFWTSTARAVPGPIDPTSPAGQR